MTAVKGLLGGVYRDAQRISCHGISLRCSGKVDREKLASEHSHGKFSERARNVELGGLTNSLICHVAGDL